MKQRHRPTYVIRSGRLAFLKDRRRVMSYSVADGADLRVRPRLRRMATAKRVPGRVNHGVLPVERWWWAGFGRDPAVWERMRYLMGQTAHPKRRPVRHELLRSAMLSAWDNHVDNVAEERHTGRRPRKAGWHLDAMRMVAIRSRPARQSRRPFLWAGPTFRYPNRPEGTDAPEF